MELEVTGRSILLYFISVCEPAWALAIDHNSSLESDAPNSADAKETVLHHLTWLIPRLIGKTVAGVVRFVATRLFLLLGLNINITLSFSTL